MHNGLSFYDVFSLVSVVLWWLLLPVLMGLAWLGRAWSRRHPWPGRVLTLLALLAAALVSYAALTIR